MPGAGTIRGVGTWEQEGLWVLRSLDELREDVRRQHEAQAVTIQADLAKAQADLNALHSKMRTLETQRVALVTRNWVTTAALSAAVALIFELLKIVFRG